MAHGWNSYFHNFPHPRDPGTLRTAEFEGAFPQHAENFTGHNVFSGTAASQGALLPNSSFNRNSCANTSTENSSSDCIYQNYCSEVQWRADGEYLEKDYLQRCGNGEVSDFATGRMPASGTFSSPFAPDLQGLKQNCELRGTSCLGNYSDVSSCSDTDAGETRPSCKFMESDFFSRQETNSFSKDNQLACFFSKTGTIPFLTDSLCTDTSETVVNLPSNVRERKNAVSCAQDEIESSEKAIKPYAGPDQSSTTSSIMATIENDALYDGNDDYGFQDQNQKQDTERNLKEFTYPDCSMSESLTGGEQYPLDEEEAQIISAAPAPLDNGQDDADEKICHGIKDSKKGLRNSDSADDQDAYVSENVQGHTLVLQRQGEKMGSLRSDVSQENKSPIPNSTYCVVENLETGCQKKAIQKTTSQSSNLPDTKELSSKLASQEQSKCTFVNNSHDGESSLQLPEQQSEIVGQGSRGKSFAEMRVDHYSDSNDAIVSESCLQPNDKKDKNIDNETKKDEELSNPAWKASTVCPLALDCKGPHDISDFSSKDSHYDKQNVSSQVESDFQLHSPCTEANPQTHEQFTSEAKTPMFSQNPGYSGPSVAVDKMAKNTANENVDVDIHVNSCIQPNGSSTSISSSLEMDMSPLEKKAQNSSKDPDCSGPNISSDGLSDISEENNERVEFHPESIEPQSLGTEKRSSPAERKTQKTSPDSDCSGPRAKADHLSSDSSDKKKQSVASKSESCFQPDNLDADMLPCLAKEWTSPTEGTSTTYPTDSKRSDQAVITDCNNQSVSCGLESCLQPNTSNSKLDSCLEEEWMSPIENANTTSLPDQYQSLHESLGAEKQSSPTGDVSENARVSFEDLDSFTQDHSVPDFLYGEPLSREDSCESDERNLDSNQYQGTSMIRPEENVYYPEAAAHELQFSFQMRDLFHPVVVLNTLEPTNGMSDSYHCMDCQLATQNVDNLIEHHYICHPMINFQFCRTCNVYLMSNGEGKRHFCDVIKESQSFFSSSVPPKKRKFQGRHKCKKCGLVFSKILHFVKHMRTHTGKTPYRCNGCGLYFAQPSSLRRHKSVPQRCKASQSPVSNFDANVCKIESPPPQEVSQQDVPQEDAPQNFSDESMKECYVKLIDISKRNVCHICGKSFATAKKAKKHVYYVHKKKEKAVTSNQSTTNDSSSLTAEDKNEARGKCKCPLCPRLFKYSYNRARHLRDCVRNTLCGGKGKVGDRYVCPLCKAAFTLPSNRYRHIKTFCLRDCLNRLAQERAKSREESKPQKSLESEQKPQSNSDVLDAKSKANVQKVQWKEDKPKKQAHPGLLASKSALRYKCNQCPAVFAHASGKYRHMKKHELFKLTGKMFKYRNSVLSLMSKTETPSTTELKKTEESTDDLRTSEETTKPALSCRFCGKCFGALPLLKKHERNHRGERPYRCLECGKGFKKRAHLLGHKIVHQKRIQCTVCKKILPTVTDLLQHRHSHLKKGMLKCPDCSAEFQYPVYLLRHLKRHANEHKKAQKAEDEMLTKPEQSLETVKDKNEQKQVQCSLCKEVFDDPQILRKHCLTHISGSSSNQCPFCRANFNSRRYLLRHMVKHTGDKSFSCTNCGKQFYRLMFLQLHTQKCVPPQTQELALEESNSKTKRPYQCSICPRRFCKKDRLQKHLAAHKKNTLHLCSRCGQYFGPNKIAQHQGECGNAAQLPTIQKSAPSDFKKTFSQASENVSKTPSQSKGTMIQFKCPYCSQKFRYRSLYLRHLVSHTGVQPYACARCGQRFGSQTMCFKHEAFCDGADKAEQGMVKSEAATKMDSLREETQKILQKDEIEYKCKFCTKTFTKARNLRYHILTHNEVKPYRCKACDSCFSRYDHLKVHQSRCKVKKTRLEVRIPKISLDDVGKGWQSKLGIKPLEKQETFDCEVCSRSFPTQSKLSRHFTMFHAPKPFKCTRCGACFSHAKTLKHHKKVRKCKRPYIESNASLALGANQPTENVTRPLAGVRNRVLLRIQPFLTKSFKYVCGFCPRSFKNSWQLSVHTRLHTGERPYPCEYCGERFIRKDYLKRHYSKCPKTQKRSKVLCDRCGGFFFESQLEKHKKACTSRQTSPTVSQGHKPTPQSPPKGFSCAYCSLRFLLFSQLQEHFLSMHTLETMNPSVSAAPLQQLLSNIPEIKEEPLDESSEQELNSADVTYKMHAVTNEGPKQYVCQECNMSFVNKAGLTGHQRVHTTVLPYSCKVCSRGFWNKTVLRTHYRKCRSKIIQRQEVPLKAEIDFALNDSKLVFKDKPNTMGSEVLQTSSANSFQVKEEEEETSVQSYEGVQSSSHKEKKAVQYQCSECDKSFTDGLLLISHLEDHGREEQEKKRNTCTKCGRVCSSQASLEKHMRFHRSNTYSCNDCSEEFSTIADLEKHNKTHGKRFSCKLCRQRFQTRPSLCEHYSTQHADAIFHCQFCSRVYAAKKSLARHYKASHPKEWKEFGSTVMEKGSSEQQSSSHVSTTGESDDNEIYISDSESDSAPYFPCHVCGKTFPTSENLEDHQLCHLGEKPHECEECGKCFLLASQLQQHQRMHKSEFQCQTCGRGFVTLFALRSHKHSHGKNRPHRCSKCDLSFPGHTQLAEHMSTHREESFPCDMCNRVFQSKSSRAEHRKSHIKAGDYPLPSVSTEEPEQSESSCGYTVQFKYRCGVCRERFRDPEELSEHGCLEAKERPYSCTDCNKYFLHASHLKKHRSTHQPSWSIREYPCSQCNSSFSSSQHFLLHLESHVDLAAEIGRREPSDSFICPVCHQCFFSPIELIHHFPTHPEGTSSLEKVQRYRSGSELKQHERQHLTSAEHECGECGESFLGDDAFHHQCFREQHMLTESKYSNKTKNRTHHAPGEEEEIDVTGEDLYKCPDCSLQFSSKSALLEHQNKHHQDRKRFECERCGKTFAKMRYLRKHENRHRLKDADGIEVQPDETKFKCGQCPTKLDTPEELSLHMRVHAEKQAGEFRCDMCYKSFSQRSLLRHHQESHVGEVVYECTECDKAFAFPHLLDEHQQTHAGSSQ